MLCSSDIQEAQDFALIAQAAAPDLDPRNFTAMTRLDHNRALAQLAGQTGTHHADIRKMIVWGNHSSTQYPDIRFTEVGDRAGVELVPRPVDRLESNGVETVRIKQCRLIVPDRFVHGRDQGDLGNRPG